MRRGIFCVSLFLLDLLSKVGALFWLPASGLFLFKSKALTFSLDLVFNTGAAWGFFPGHPKLLFFLRSAIIAGLFLYMLQKKCRAFPLWLLLTGAVGNIVDYMLYGHVVDFLHFRFFGHSFPVFNLADSYISIAFFLLLILPKGVSYETKRLSS